MSVVDLTPGLCDFITRVFQKSGESDRGDSLAPTDLLLSPSDCSVNRSIINISLSDLSEAAYQTHYDIGTILTLD